jgi:serine/threonine-protein kinase
LAPAPPDDPPPGSVGADGIEDEDSFDDESEDIVTRLHVMPEGGGATGPYPGAVIARKYLLKGEIAKGGMGSVWRAIDMGLERPVAIKFMDPRIVEDEDLKKRFAREAKAAARLTTPHVVQVYEYGIERGIPFIAMELLDGEDLHERLKRDGPLDLDLVSEIVSQIARGLRSAQDAKVVHRDLKPQNIFLADEGGGLLIKILDFGVAKIRAAAERGDETKAGTVLGSPHYMSPEQARGRPEIDHRADIWSLGVIAFRALTGKMAFPGDAPGEVILRICTDPIPIPSKFNDKLPKAVDEIFARVLEREPEDRYQSAVEFAAGLERVARLSAPQHRAPTTPMKAMTDQRGDAVPGGAMPPPQHPPLRGPAAGMPPMDRPPLQGPAAGMPPAQPAAAVAAAAKQATPWPSDGGTPASAIHAAAPPLNPSSAIQPVDKPTGMDGGTPHSSIKPFVSPPLDQAPAPAAIKHGEAGVDEAELAPWTASAAAPPPLAQAGGQFPGAPAPASTPGAPLPSDPGTPQSPLLASPLPYAPADQQPPSSRDGLAPYGAPGAPMGAPALHQSGDAIPMPDSSDRGPASGQHIQPPYDSGEYPATGPQSGGLPLLVDEDSVDCIEAPTVVQGQMPGIGGPVYPPPLLLDELELDMRPRRGLSVVVGVGAAAVVLLLIASVLIFGSPDPPETDVSTAPIPSTLLDEAPPVETDTPPGSDSEPSTTSGDEQTTSAEQDAGSGDEPETSKPDPDDTAKPEDDGPKKPRRPTRPGPRPSDEWGY